MVKIAIALSLMSGVVIALLKGVSLILRWLGWEFDAESLLGNE